ncbi:uncharacterized protein LOC106665385 isoform X2 [Cimex lectularius]|uniref:Uncharacterized protein n=1 Tax=Cimex lectularius TaxID=79782 RepID=A0A8I6RNQ3_CIMLE|nr:uncharacterized protein LOC106665385 isoform X2 [Cimex lectularius]
MDKLYDFFSVLQHFHRQEYENSSSGSIYSIPGGSGGMLRSRRRDANAKPNRVLDRNSSRGMIFENEELRLRTININEEIEKGQNDIKKLRRENEQLRREIWSLRDECDRLQELLKRQEEEDDEDETEYEEDEQEIETKVERNHTKKFEGDGLSIVPEEPEEATTPDCVLPQITSLIKEVNNEKGLLEYKGRPSPCLRINSVHPFTAAATLDLDLFPGVTVFEVIEDAIKVCQGVVGVRLLSGSIYISCESKESLDLLINSGLKLRNEQISLYDVSQGTVVLDLKGVPHHLTDCDLAHVLSQFGPVIGAVERKLYCDVDTGERLARIKPRVSIPKRLFLQGSEIVMRPLAHEELVRLSIQQCPLKLNVKLPVLTDIADIKDTLPTNSTLSASCDTAKSTSAEPFVFPGNSSASTVDLTAKMEERCQSAPNIRSQQGSPVNTVRRGISDGEVKRAVNRTRKISKKGPSPLPSSSSEQDSPTKPRRRRSSVLQPPVSFEKEISPSLSSRASFRRKLSATGRETGKLPWCACWGNGCI